MKEDTNHKNKFKIQVYMDANSNTTYAIINYWETEQR